MEDVTGTYENGQIKLDHEVAWQDGVRVMVSPVTEPLGLSEADWVDSEEARAELLKRLDEIEPLEFTPAEQAEIEAAREAVRQVTIRQVRARMGLEP